MAFTFGQCYINLPSANFLLSSSQSLVDFFKSLSFRLVINIIDLSKSIFLLTKTDLLDKKGYFRKIHNFPYFSKALYNSTCICPFIEVMMIELSLFPIYGSVVLHSRICCYHGIKLQFPPLYKSEISKIFQKSNNF